jgi:hypothetical protein
MVIPFAIYSYGARKSGTKKIEFLIKNSKNQKKCLRQIRKFKRTAEIRIAPTVQPAVKDEDANDKEVMQTARMSPLV